MSRTRGAVCVNSPPSLTTAVCISGPDGEIGASKLTGEVLDIMSRVPETIKRMTGVDLGEVRGRRAGDAGWLLHITLTCFPFFFFSLAFAWSRRSKAPSFKLDSRMCGRCNCKGCDTATRPLS